MNYDSILDFLSSNPVLKYRKHAHVRTKKFESQLGFWYNEYSQLIHIEINNFIISASRFLTHRVLYASVYCTAGCINFLSFDCEYCWNKKPHIVRWKMPFQFAMIFIGSRAARRLKDCADVNGASYSFPDLFIFFLKAFNIQLSRKCILTSFDSKFDAMFLQPL